MDAAKTTHDKFVSGSTEIKIAPKDRSDADVSKGRNSKRRRLKAKRN
jgi:hypothetical protein